LGPISFDGLSNLRTGMTVAEIESRAGHRIKVDYSVSPPCGTAVLSKRDRVYLLLDGKHVERFDVRGTRFSTGRGIRVGSSEPTLVSRYGGRLRRSLNIYTHEPQYAYTRGHRRIIFFTRHRRVAQISTGRVPEIDYDEGCA
jgi:hypothetical protein